VLGVLLVLACGAVGAGAQDEGDAAQQVRKTYAGALRYFRPQLDEAAAEQLAAAIMESSRRYGLDARLPVAVVAAEGTLSQVCSSPAGLQVGSRSAGKAVESLADSLRRQIERRAHQGGTLDLNTIRQALMDRAATHGGKGRSSPAAYARHVVRIYTELCGADQAAG
jgi:hypothetical protein